MTTNLEVTGGFNIRGIIPALAAREETSPLATTDPANCIDDLSTLLASKMTSFSSALIVVSNRLPFTLEKDKAGRIRRRAAAGGLGTAVAPVVVQSKGEYWFFGKCHCSQWRLYGLYSECFGISKLELDPAT